MVWVAVTKMVACSEMAMAGTTDSRQSMVRHSSTATATRQTAITYSVLPSRDQTAVTAFHASVRPRLRPALRPSSTRSIPASGPVRSSPTPTMTTQMATPGATARVRRARPSSR